MQATLNLPRAKKIRRYYESYASNQFILHGNIHDNFILPNNEIGNLSSALEILTQTADILITYRIDRGLWVERGGSLLGATLGQSKLGTNYSPEQCIPELAFLLRKLTLSTKTPKLRVAVVVHDADKIVPAVQPGINYELSHLVSTIYSWSSDSTYKDYPLAVFLVTDTMQGLNAQLTRNNKTIPVYIEPPCQLTLKAALQLWVNKYKQAIQVDTLDKLATTLRGVSLANLEQELKLYHYDNTQLTQTLAVDIKKRLVEKEMGELLEFIAPKKTLSNMSGMEPIKELFTTYAAMWQEGRIAKFPKGVLASGPVGTGKTYLVECVSGSIGFPVVKLKNFRDKWYGNTEANLERIFRALRALAPCVVFIDEADQALGKRDSDSNDGGLSGRIYSAMAQEMSDPTTRGQILWFLATSRPDLIEVDLKRPGRIDVKLALMPTGTKQESLALLKALLSREGLLTNENNSKIDNLIELLPVWLTPGAVEAICSDIYSGLGGDITGDVTGELTRILKHYQPPVRLDVMERQIRIAAEETTRTDLLPEQFRAYRLNQSSN